jgi:hypothetical protein
MGLFSSDSTQEITAAIGRPTTFFENIAQGFEQQWTVDSPYSLEFEVQDAWKDTLKRYTELTGKTPAFQQDMEALNAYARTTQGEELSFWQRQPGSSAPSAQLAQSIAQFKVFNEEIKALNNPELKSFETVLEEVYALQRETEKQTAISAETGGVTGAIGQFIGAVGGTLTYRDPLSLASLGVGGIGKTLFTRVLTGAAVSGTLVASTEFGAVLPNRELAGLPERSGLFNVAVGAAAGGFFEGLGILARRLLTERAATRQLAEESVIAQRQATEGELRALIEGLTNPEARGLAHLLEMEDAVTAKSPYGTSPAGLKRFTAELEDIRGVFSGKTDTAIGLTLPPIPFDQFKKAADFDIVREVDPVAYGRLEAAQLKLQNIQDEVDGLETSLPRLEDAINSIDPETGALVRSYLDDLDQPGLTAARRQDIERKLDVITESLNPAFLVRRLQDIGIGPKKSLQQRRSALRSANKEYKKAHAEVEAVRARINREQEQVEIVQRKLIEQDLKKAIAGGKAPAQLGAINGETAAVLARQLREIEAELDDQAIAILARFDETADELDLGLAEKIDPELTFIGADGNSVSARSIMQELREDARLDEAMRSCVL